MSDYLNVDTTTNAVVFSGANVYVQSGSGYTDDDGTIDPKDLDSDDDGHSDADEAGDTLLETPPIDTDKDGDIDQWTPFKRGREKYRQQEGFVRVVEKSPAVLHTAALP